MFQRLKIAWRHWLDLVPGRREAAAGNDAVVKTDLAPPRAVEPWPRPMSNAVGDDNAPDFAKLSRRQAHAARQRAAEQRFGPPPAAMWMVCGNVVPVHRYGPGGCEQKSGLRLLKPGAKVTVCRLLRNASPERVTVVGRHRTSNRYLTVILETRLLHHLRVQLVRSPYVIRQHWASPVQRHAYGRDADAAHAALAELLACSGADAAAPVARHAGVKCPPSGARHSG